MGSTEWFAAGEPSQQRCLLMAKSNLHEKNLLFFTSAYPSVAEIARVRETELTQPVFDDAGHVIDIDIGHKRLYDRPAAEFAAEQVDSFWAQPTRIVVEPPNLDDLHDACCHTIADTLEVSADNRLTQPPLDRGGVLMVVGIGLGLGFNRLLRTAKLGQGAASSNRPADVEANRIDRLQHLGCALEPIFASPLERFAEDLVQVDRNA